MMSVFYRGAHFFMCCTNSVFISILLQNVFIRQGWESIFDHLGRQLAIFYSVSLHGQNFTGKGGGGRSCSGFLPYEKEEK